MSLNVQIKAPQTIEEVAQVSTNNWPKNMSKNAINFILNSAEVVIERSEQPDISKCGFCVQLLNRIADSNIKYLNQTVDNKKKLCKYTNNCIRIEDCRFSHCEQMVVAANRRALGYQPRLSSTNPSASSSSGPNRIHSALRSSAAPFAPKSLSSSSSSSLSSAPVGSSAAPFTPKYLSSSSSSYLSSAPVGSSAAPMSASSAAASWPIERATSHDSVISSLSQLAAKTADSVLTNGNSAEDEAIVVPGPDSLTRSFSGNHVDPVSADTSHLAADVAISAFWDVQD